MHDRVVEHLRAGFARYDDLIANLPASTLKQRLPTRSNTLGAQFWCIVGARESYTRAITENGWAGFACSLSAEAANNPASIREALAASAAEFERVVGGIEWTEEREEQLLALLEHETQHQGQLIRYAYAMNITFPDSWATRWALQP